MTNEILKVNARRSISTKRNGQTVSLIWIYYIYRRDYIPQFELHILFDHLDQEHATEEMNIDWMKKYRMLRKYFLSHMLVGQMMDMVNSCTTGVKKDKKIEKAPEPIDDDEGVEEDDDDDDSEAEDADEYHNYVENLLDVNYSNRWWVESTRKDNNAKS